MLAKKRINIHYYIKFERILCGDKNLSPAIRPCKLCNLGNRIQGACKYNQVCWKVNSKFSASFGLLKYIAVS